MNGIENVTEKIREEAAKYSEQLLSAARDDAKSIAEDYKEKAERARGEILFAAKQKAENSALRASSQGDIAARNRRLAARREAISAAFELALVKLEEIDEEKYIAWMTREIKGCQSADAELILNARDRARLGEALISRAKGEHALCLAEKTGDFAGGFMLKEGQIDTNSTFEVLISSGREDLEGEIAAVLFG